MKGNDLVYIGGPVNEEQVMSRLAVLEKRQPPTLDKVRDSSLPDYKTAQSYQAKIAGDQVDIKNIIASTKENHLYQDSYLALNNVQTAITNNNLGSSDPATEISNGIVNPLITAQAAMQKNKPTANYVTLHNDLQKGFTDFITAGNTLLAMYKSGNMQDVNYNYYDDVLTTYNDLGVAIKNFNDMATSLGNKLIAQAK